MGRSESPAILASPLLNPELHLKAVLDMLERAREELIEAQVTADSFSGMDLPADTPESDVIEAREKVRANVRRCFARYQELNTQARKAEADFRRRAVEAPLTGRWSQEHVRLRRELQQQYEGLGPQYDLLCDNAAATAVMLRQLEMAGGDFDMSTWKDINELHLKYVGQLQRYTEAMKSESVNRQTQEVAIEIIRVFEAHFGNAYPDVWRKATIEIKSLIEGYDAA